MKKKVSQKIDTGNGRIFVSASASKKSINAAIEEIGTLFSSRALKPLNSIDKSLSRIFCVPSNNNPSTRIVSCYCPTNVSDKMDIITFYNGFSSPVRYIPKNNVLTIGEEINVQIDKNENNKFCLLNLPYRNGEYLTDLSLENSLSCLNTKFKKKMERKLWNNIYLNNSKAQLNYILIKKKWMNIAVNCEAYSVF